MKHSISNILRRCLIVTVGTVIVVFVLIAFWSWWNNDALIACMVVSIIITNCTVFICGKLNRIQQKLDKIVPDSVDEA